MTLLQPLATDRDAPEWTNAYVGIPFDESGTEPSGTNCCGLVRLVLRDQAGVTVPTYREHYRDLGDEGLVSDLIRAHLPEWLPVVERPPGLEAIDLTRVRMLDVVLMNVEGRPLHVGVVVGRGKMLHVERGIDAVVERFDRGPWGRRVVGIYRHRELAE